ncbi:MAG TPA: recombinase family protein [Symbiobacteriaceae bacterium]|nr:recombinase family protein [Symbiobacteriaceae bacterium]
MERTETICPTKVAAYIRWSTDDQTDGTTLEVQRESCMHYIKAQGWQFSDGLCFIDDGYSGGSLDRPAITRLREAVREGRVSCIVVYKLDRLSRSVLDTVNLVLEEWDGKCHVKSTREPIDTTTPAGKMFFYMLVSYAEWERSVIRERTLSGKKKRAEQGKNPGMKFPFGYCRGDKVGEYAIDEAQAAVVRRVFRDYEAGKGLLTIANELNDDGTASKFGTPWRATSIQYMLRNEAYKGVLVFGSRIDVKDKTTGKRKVVTLSEPRHARVERALPAIIDAELWERVQRLMKQRALAPRRNLAGDYLLSGIARCRCGSPLVGNLIDGKYRFYACAARRNQGAALCNAATLHADHVEQKIIDAVKAHYSQSSEDGYVTSVLADLRHQLQIAEAAVEQWTGKADELNRRMARLHRDYDAGELTGRIYSERVEATQAELAEVKEGLLLAQAQVSDLRQRLDSGETIRGEFRQLVNTVSTWESLSGEEQKQVLRHVVESLTVWCVSKERDPRNRRKFLHVVDADLVLRKISEDFVVMPLATVSVH